MWCWNELGLEKVMWSPSGKVGFLWVLRFPPTLRDHTNEDIRANLNVLLSLFVIVVVKQIKLMNSNQVSESQNVWCIYNSCGICFSNER